MVYVLLATGFEEVEAITPVDLLRRADIPVTTVGVNGKTVFGGHNIGVEADITLDEMNPADLEMVMLPGGLGGVASVRANQKAMDMLRCAWDNGKFVAAICAGPTVLADLGITDEKSATCHPSCVDGMGQANMVADVPCVRDGMLITGTSAGCAVPFGLMLIAALKGQAVADTIKQQFIIR